MWRKWALGGLLVVVLLGAGVAFWVYQTLQSDPIPLGAPSGEIAFISNREGVWDLFLLDAAGTLTRLTTGEANDYFASWAFDGEMINFLSDRHGDEIGPAQVGPDGGDLRTLSIVAGALEVIRTGRIDWDPVWFPDGERIVWSSLRDLNLEIYVGDPDGQNAQRLTNHPTNDWFPTISPDGTEILFISDRESDVFNIYRFGTDGEGLTQLTDSTFDELHPTWSSDGERILFISDIDDELLEGKINLFVMDADGANQRRLGDDEVFEGDPVYAADGQQVVYMSNEGGFWHLYLMDADGSNIRRLTEGDSDNMFPVWRPVPAEQD